MNKTEALIELQKLANLIDKQKTKSVIQTAIDTYEVYTDYGLKLQTLYIQEVEGEWMVKKR